MTQDIGANPLLIFSLVERLRTQIKGTGMFAETIHTAFAQDANYYKIIQLVKDKGTEDYNQTLIVVPEDLLKDILAFDIPKRLLTKQK